MRRRALLATTTGLLSLSFRARAAEERHLLYVASPGIRNYVEYGGVGVLVFDIARGHRFLERIPTFPVAPGEAAENVKGIVASAAPARLFVSTPKRIGAFDLETKKALWSRAYEGGCDRLAISPDGRTLYVPSFEGPHWHVVDAVTAEVRARIETGSGAHNTLWSLDGRQVFLAGLKSPILRVADPQANAVVKEVGPFSAEVRPFTVNGRGTLAFVNVNERLGFEVGDVRTGRVLHRVDIGGVSKGPVKRHGCPSHGVGLTPDERELWVADAANGRVHVFDVRDVERRPPRQGASILLRDQPGWVTFSLDGRYAYPSTGEVIDVRTKKIVATLTDEAGRPVQSEKMVEVVWRGERVVRVGDQFGIGRRG